MHGIKDNLEVRYVGAAVAAGSSIDSNSSRIDMSGYESVMFLTTITDSVATGVATLVIQENDADSDTGMANVTGTNATLTCATNDDINGELLVTELRLPAKRYVQATRTSATANIAYGEVIAILKPYTKPVTQHSTVGDLNYVSN
jgi:hypothetical protein